MMRKETLEGYTASKSYESDGYKLLYWLDEDGRPHRGEDLPAIVKVSLSTDEIMERTWMRHGMEHRGYGRPSYVGKTVQRYVADGRPYDVDRSFKALYTFFYEKGLDTNERKKVFDHIVSRYFLNNAIDREQVIEYAKARLEQINTTQACHGMKYQMEGGHTMIQETSSKNPDVVFRFEETGGNKALFNDTVPRGNPGKVHNYVIVFYPEHDGTMASHVEFLAMNLVEIKSKHAHILLSSIAPRFPNFKYFISGECVYDEYKKTLSLNIQSGMNWQLNLSRYTQEDFAAIMERIRTDVAEGVVGIEGPGEDFGYVLLQDILRGRGPSGDLFGAISCVFFEHVLSYSLETYSTSSFRGQTKENIGVLRDWCNEGISIKTFDSKQTCEAEPRGGLDVKLSPGLFFLFN
jgi:hypothetical protein